MTKKEITIKVLKIAGSVIFYVWLAAMLIFSIANLRQNKTKVDSYPNIFGYGMLYVQSDSMKGDLKDDFKTGDLIFIKSISTKKLSKLKVGQIVTFYDTTLTDAYSKGYLNNCLNTHRIVYIDFENDYLVTQGDANATTNINLSQYNYDINGDGVVNSLDVTTSKYVAPIYDSNGVLTNEKEFSANEYRRNSSGDYYYEEISFTNVRGLYSSKINNGGAFFKFLSSQIGFGLCISLPLFLFLILEVFVLIKRYNDINHEKKKIEISSEKNEMMAELEAQKEAMRKEILAELMKEQADKNVDKEKEEEPSKPEDDSSDTSKTE